VKHDIIAIGASAGGVEVLLNMAPKLPPDLPASVFVAIHSSRDFPSTLPELMNRRGKLMASHPLHGDKIVPGHIYVAPPDTQLYLRQGSMEIVRGPRENGHRPSVDALFRTASMVYGPRVVGVVLSGYQDCGTAGMMSIKARGGVSVVQDPASAQAPDMPRSVIERVHVDHVVTPDELPELLTRLAVSPAGAALAPPNAIAQLEGAEPGDPAELVCPICQGVLSEAQPGLFGHFRCHVGHAFTLQSLVHEQSEELERALWAAVRALEESASLSRRLCTYGSGSMDERFAEKAKTQTDHAEIIRQILLHGSILSKADASNVPKT
jgi:two-component system chemotaxis response regulator CheB